MVEDLLGSHHLKSEDSWRSHLADLDGEGPRTGRFQPLCCSGKP